MTCVIMLMSIRSHTQLLTLFFVERIYVLLCTEILEHNYEICSRPNR